MLWNNFICLLQRLILIQGKRSKGKKGSRAIKEGKRSKHPDRALFTCFSSSHSTFCKSGPLRSSRNTLLCPFSAIRDWVWLEGEVQKNRPLCSQKAERNSKLPLKWFPSLDRCGFNKTLPPFRPCAGQSWEKQAELCVPVIRELMK